MNKKKTLFYLSTKTLCKLAMKSGLSCRFRESRNSS